MAETARENQVSSAAVKYETVADMGSGLVIAKVKLTDFREQDINARIMKTEMQKQLTDNIKSGVSLKASRSAHSSTAGSRLSPATTASVLQRTAVC